MFLALGASRGQVQALLLPEVCVLGLTACGAGAVLGVPLAFGLWQLFRAFVVDSGEMVLRFDFGALAWPLAFAAYTVLMLLWMGRRSVRRASIMEVVRQSHTAEPVRAVPRFYGWLGILLTAAGCLCGYLVPTICVRWLHWYAPAIFTAPFYLPALAGLYMMLLHTVANGWGRRAAWHRDILSVSMMRFEGRQTVRNMLVMTVLIGGACFAGFYAPMLGTGSMLSYDARPVDFAFHYRADQDMPQKDEVLALAEGYGVEVTHWAEAPMARLGWTASTTWRPRARWAPPGRPCTASWIPRSCFCPRAAGTPSPARAWASRRGRPRRCWTLPAAARAGSPPASAL